VKNAPLVSVKAIKVKLRVPNAAPGNTTMLRVLPRVKFAERILSQTTKIVRFPVMNVGPVVPPNQAVSSVPIVHLVHLKTLSITTKSVLNAQRGLLKVKQIKPIALNAEKEKKHQMLVAVFVRCVVWVDSI
jgi:hypothetical protein